MPDHPAAAAFRRITAWIAAHVPEPGDDSFCELFAPPATDAALDELSRTLATPAAKGLTVDTLRDPFEPDPAEALHSDGPALGRPLPNDLAAVLRVHDGGSPCGYLPFPPDGEEPRSCHLLSAGRIAGIWRGQRDAAAVGLFFTPGRSVTDPGVRKTGWDVGWVPFADSGVGDYVCLDYAPARGGILG